MFALAEHNGIAIPYASVDDVRAAYAFSNLQDFPDIYDAGRGIASGMVICGLLAEMEEFRRSSQFLRLHC